jgi:hypothetical protein
MPGRLGVGVLRTSIKIEGVYGRPQSDLLTQSLDCGFIGLAKVYSDVAPKYIQGRSSCQSTLNGRSAKKRESLFSYLLDRSTQSIDG